MPFIRRTLGIVMLVMLFVTPFAAAQDDDAILPKDVLHCETLEDINQAKADGVIFIEFRNNFWVKVGADYKGPFRYLKSAQKIYNQHKLDAMNRPASAQLQGATGANREPSSFYNPQLILFPFIEYMPNRRVVFSIPGGQTVSASQVMIHPEPLEFENVTFGMIDLSLFTKEIPNNQKTPAQRIPQTVLNRPFDKYFAVTGGITARETVTMPTAPLTYWVGAAVVGKDGSLLWRQYGQVESDRTFKCLGRIPNTSIVPEFLLLFTLANGKLEYNIRPLPKFPKQDARPYDYHVLGSSTLEMGPNWFPPMQAATKAEYDKLMDEMNRKKIEEFKKKAPQTKRP